MPADQQTVSGADGEHELGGWDADAAAGWGCRGGDDFVEQGGTGDDGVAGEMASRRRVVGRETQFGLGVWQGLAPGRLGEQLREGGLREFAQGVAWELFDQMKRPGKEGSVDAFS